MISTKAAFSGRSSGALFSQSRTVIDSVPKLTGWPTGASKREIFWHLRVPNTLPYFFAALRLNVSLALIGAIVGELVGARDGVGHMMTEAALTLRTTDVFSGVVILTVLGVVLTELVTIVQARVLYWHETERS